jgi:hypothetical protein
MSFSFPSMSALPTDSPPSLSRLLLAVLAVHIHLLGLFSRYNLHLGIFRWLKALTVAPVVGTWDVSRNFESLFPRRQLREVRDGRWVFERSGYAGGRRLSSLGVGFGVGVDIIFLGRSGFLDHHLRLDLGLRLAFEVEFGLRFRFGEGRGRTSGFDGGKRR